MTDEFLRPITAQMEACREWWDDNRDEIQARLSVISPEGQLIAAFMMGVIAGTGAGGPDGYGVVKPPFDADDMLGAAVKAAIDEKQHGGEGGHSMLHDARRGSWLRDED
jgi:hypothetical protein